MKLESISDEAIASVSFNVSIFSQNITKTDIS